MKSHVYKEDGVVESEFNEHSPARPPARPPACLFDNQNEKLAATPLFQQMLLINIVATAEYIASRTDFMTIEGPTPNTSSCPHQTPLRPSWAQYHLLKSLTLRYNQHLAYVKSNVTKQNQNRTPPKQVSPNPQMRNLAAPSHMNGPRRPLCSQAHLALGCTAARCIRSRAKDVF